MHLQFEKYLENIVGEKQLKKDYFLREVTFIQLGGMADYYVTPKTYEEVTSIKQLCNQHDVCLTILGKGTNVIIRDGGIRGVVLSLEELNEVKIIEEIIKSQAGATLIDVAKIALQNNLSGLEFACGIPGTIGGAVYMNAGAYGGEIKDCLVSALILKEDGSIVSKRAEDLNLKYRSSNIIENKEIVLEATFRLHKDIKENIKAKMDEWTQRRKNSQPLDLPSCGSVFKRPADHYVGPMIIDCGLQGYTIGGAQVSKKHAGFIVNINDATANDYIALIELIKARVKEKFDIELECEVQVIGDK